MRVLFLLSLLAALVHAQPPQFPTDYSSTETTTVLQNQNTFAVGDAICCNLNGNCQVQVQYVVGKSYVDYTHNRTRSDSAGSTVVTFYDPAIQRECNVVNNTCTEYCPTQGETLSPQFLSANATNIGNTVVNGKTYQQWQWKDVILGIVVMDVVTVLVDPSTNPATPYQQTTLLTPFGQYAGTETTVFQGFTWGTPDAGLFNISGVMTAPQSQNCGSDQNQQRRLANGLYTTWLYWEQKKMLSNLNVGDI